LTLYYLTSGCIPPDVCSIIVNVIVVIVLLIIIVVFMGVIAVSVLPFIRVIFPIGILSSSTDDVKEVISPAIVECSYNDRYSISLHM
jgi:hypothetical protein